MLDEKSIKLMSEAGCIEMFIGIEIGSNRMERVTRKNLNLSKIDPLFRALSKNNIRVDVSLIFGFPEEEFEDLLDTLNLIQNIKQK